MRLPPRAGPAADTTHIGRSYEAIACFSSQTISLLIWTILIESIGIVLLRLLRFFKHVPRIRFRIYKEHNMHINTIK